MSKKELLSEHYTLKEMPFRKDWNSSEEERQEYYKALKEHIRNVAQYFCKGDCSLYQRDFWWVHDAFSVLLTARRPTMDKELRNFVDLYFETVLMSLHNNIEDGQMNEVVYIDYAKSKVLGFKYYEKKKGAWIGQKYVKFSKEQV